MRVEMLELAEKIPPNSAELLKSVKDVQASMHTMKNDYSLRFLELERDTTFLKKKQNLAELEHRVCDKIDEVARALTRIMADKFDTSKRFRMIENRVQSLMEIMVMSSTPESEPQLRKIFASLIKGSKKMKNPSVLPLHIKT